MQRPTAPALFAAACLLASSASAQNDGGAAPDAPPAVPAQNAAADASTRAPPGVAIDRMGLTPAQEARYVAGLQAYQQRRYPDAIQIYMDLARQNNCCGVLGMVVASLASTAPTPERAAAAAQEADAAPDDILKQFVAGVLAHYAAHVNGRDQEEKTRLYRQAIRYLERTRSTLTTEPRLFIYLAVSNFRLGNQREAEQFIERAVELAAHDPDAYYCRAEIFQRVNVRRSVADIDTYLRMNAENEARGAVGDPGKTERVRLMRAHLIAVSEGREQPTELFDPVAAQRRALEGAGGRAPLPDAASGARGGPGHAPQRSRALYVLGAAALAAGGWALGRRGARRDEPAKRTPE
jgi:tetratricopeptide (TPR) repeat protein